MPAFGCAASGMVVTARTRSMASSIATGPILQLQPITSAPQTRARPVDLVDLVREAVPSESKAVRTKSIGFNDFCASLQVALMHGVNHFRLRQVQLVVRAVDENTVRIQQCAHRAITKNGRLT